jgi:SMI1 / KNR4 family (SUKH-1)
LSDLDQEWKVLLTDYNDFVLQSSLAQLDVPAEARQAGWCGRPPESEENIRSTESRLGVTLPPSYREFLKVTNGWMRFDTFISNLWPAQQIDRFRTLYPERVVRERLGWDRVGRPTITDEEYFDYANAFTGAYRDEYLPECIVLGQGVDNELVLLNPMVIGSDGECEAWYFASWIPGAYRYRSFLELVRGTFEDTKEAFPS